MHRWLTVEENLWIYARLRQRTRAMDLPRSTHGQGRRRRTGSSGSSGGGESYCGSGGGEGDERQRRLAKLGVKVANIMHVLGLWDHRKSIIGDEKTRGISGGQCKRVNVAMELVADPSVLFLDEPTTGLDSTTSFELVHALKAIASHRKVNVAAVIHQPSVSKLSSFLATCFLCPSLPSPHLSVSPAGKQAVRTILSLCRFVASPFLVACVFAHRILGRINP